jgi:hypothetical protein
MLSWPPTVRIFLCSDATDMRKGFDSLAHLVESSLTLDPMSGGSNPNESVPWSVVSLLPNAR